MKYIHHYSLWQWVCAVLQQTYLAWKVLHFDSNAIEIHSQESNQRKASIGLADDKQLSEPMVAYPDSKVHGANMGPTCVLSAPDWPHQGYACTWDLRYLDNLDSDYDSMRYCICLEPPHFNHWKQGTQISEHRLKNFRSWFFISNT